MVGHPGLQAGRTFNAREWGVKTRPIPRLRSDGHLRTAVADRDGDV
jgi:hypothetical protein